MLFHTILGLLHEGAQSGFCEFLRLIFGFKGHPCSQACGNELDIFKLSHPSVVHPTGYTDIGPFLEIAFFA